MSNNSSFMLRRMARKLCGVTRGWIPPTRQAQRHRQNRGRPPQKDPAGLQGHDREDPDINPEATGSLEACPGRLRRWEDTADTGLEGFSLGRGRGQF
uniref:Uncharacterized protein n=1 Tax=Sphaerodactylus townsendi TaxID=933632 RepID=A0ACB8G902_9SAUR